MHKVLIVEDEEASRKEMKEALEDDGYECAEAETAEQALERLQSDAQIDILITDLIMPGKSGLDLAREVKAEWVGREMEFILITGHGGIKESIEALQLGFIDYLVKPIGLLELVHTVHIAAQLIDLKRDRREKEERIEQLLLQVLPKDIVRRIGNGETLIADSFENATVLFSDLVRFTSISSHMSPQEVVESLNRIFLEFDNIAIRLNVEKVKTIGDAYLAVAGVPEPRSDHIQAMADMALTMQEALEQINDKASQPFEMRLGLYTGPIAGGIIGKHRFIYDIWGDTVNMANRFESYSVPGRIHVPESIAKFLDEKYVLEPRGVLEIRGKGPMNTYFLNGRK
ncbi:MAG: response regulator [Woeseia sp.]|jgi:adenylate cyclase|nr:response regulator [Woeseia sp.]